jgi:hypothetical protein
VLLFFARRQLASTEIDPCSLNPSAYFATLLPTLLPPKQKEGQITSPRGATVPFCLARRGNAILPSSKKRRYRRPLSHCSGNSRCTHTLGLWTPHDACVTIYRGTGASERSHGSCPGDGRACPRSS